MAFRSASSNTGTSDTPNTPVPTGAAAGDIVILVVTGDLIPWSPSTNFPSGFTSLATDTNTFDNQTAAIGWKRLTGSDAGSYTFTDVGNSAPWCCGAICLSGRHATNPPVVGATGKQNSGQTSPVTIGAPTVTALAGDDLVQASVPDVNGSGIGNGFTAPASPGTWAERVDNELTFSNLGIFTTENVSAGATGTVNSTFALTSGQTAWLAWLVRVPAAPGGGTGWTQPVDDTLTSADTIAKAPKHPIADTGTLSDANAKTATHPIADTGTLTDAASKAPKHPIADTGTLTDAVSKAAKPAIADTGTLADANAKAVGHTVTDTGTLTEATAKSVTHPIADTGTLSDNISTGGATNYTLPLDDTLTSSDTIAKSAKHPVADTGTWADTISKTPRKALADTGTFADVRVWTATVRLADTATLSDSPTSPSFPPTQDTSINLPYQDPSTRARYLEASHAGHQEPAHLAYREHT